MVHVRYALCTKHMPRLSVVQALGSLVPRIPPPSASGLGEMLARGLRGLAASLTRPLTSSLPLLSACRTILTVNVHAPSAHSGNDLRAEIKRYEEIASAKLNRMVQTEIRLGTLIPPGRRMKRYSRFTKPKEQRRLAGACTPEGVGRALLPRLLLVPAGLAPW